MLCRVDIQLANGIARLIKLIMCSFEKMLADRIKNAESNGGLERVIAVAPI